MATCSVRKFDDTFIGAFIPGLETSFTTKMYSFGGDLSPKQLIRLGLTINWDKDLDFTVIAYYRQSVMSDFITWNFVSTETTFDTYGIINNEGITSTDGSYSFELPYAGDYNSPDDSDVITSFKNVQFKIVMNINGNNSNANGNISINDISIMYRKKRSYGQTE